MSRLNYGENKKQVCKTCGGRMKAKIVHAKGVIWECVSCGYELNEQYSDPGRVVHESKRAWEN